MREGVIIAVAGAVAAALATALFSGFGDWLTGNDEESGSSSDQSSSSAQPPSEVKAVTSADGAVTVRIPATWGTHDADWALAFVPSPRRGAVDSKVRPGSGIQAGTGAGLSDSFSYDSESLWVGASSTTADALDLPGRSAEELIDYLRVLAHTIPWEEGGRCTDPVEGELEVEGYHVAYRRWSDCGGFTGQSLWDVYGVPESGEFLMGALLVSTLTSEAEQLAMLTDWTVEAGALPTGDGLVKEPSVFEYPLPPWYER